MMKKRIFVKKSFFCTEFYSAYENDAYFNYFGGPGPQKDYPARAVLTCLASFGLTWCDLT